jgi:diguanylate cyclase (GGDEF)-like protein
MSAEALHERLEEEINRAGRHDTALSCLLVTIGNLEELAREHGSELFEETLAYVLRTLAAQVRGFDRIGRPSEDELLLILPGADGPRGEVVARRVLERLRTIKVEVEGTRQPLRISVGLAAWHESLSAGELLERARLAAWRGNGSETAPGLPSSSPPILGRPHGPA